MTIEYKLINTIDGEKVDRKKLKIGFFLIGRIHQDFYGMAWRCPKCKKLCALQQFTIGNFLSNKIEPTFLCGTCHDKKIFDKDEFKNVLYRIWVDDRLFEKNVVYIYSENNKDEIKDGKQTKEIGEKSI